jgi:hypothetical protein
MRGHVALRGEHDRRPHLGDVGVGKAAVHADGKDVGQRLVAACQRDALHHRPGVGAAAVDLFQQRPAHAQAARADLALHRALQDVGRVARGHAHVGVRVGLERHHDVGQVHHLPRDVGVRVQRDGDGYARPDGRAQPAQQLAFAVIVRCGAHGAVQAQQHAVQARAGLQPAGGVDDGRGQGVEGLVGDTPAGLRVRADRVCHRPAMRARRFEKAAQLGVVVAPRGDGGVAMQQATFGKAVQRGGQRAEGVGLVQQLGGQHLERGRVGHVSHGGGGRPVRGHRSVPARGVRCGSGRWRAGSVRRRHSPAAG